MCVKLNELLPNFGEVFAFSTVITAVAQKGIVEAKILVVGAAQGSQSPQEVGGGRGEEADELEQADAPSIFSPQRTIQRTMEDVGRTGDQKESGFEQDEHFGF